MSAASEISPGRRIGLLRRMMLIREFELELYRQYDAGRIKGTLHICLGQEGVAVGCCDPLSKDDLVTSTHRGHGHLLAKGGSPARMMAEIFGRRSGYCLGKGGTQHMASLEQGFLASNGITGGGIPYATGLALALKLQGRSSVVVCFFGDGASNQGTFHESLNLATLWRLPIVYVCENNQYAFSSPTERMVAAGSVVRRAAAYGMPGHTVDGNDVLTVAEQMREIVARVRAGKGPALVEARTYRMAGHSRNDRCLYRPAGESERWAARCPIARLRDRLLDDGLLDAAGLEAMTAEVRQEIGGAVAEADAEGRLTRAEVLSGTYSQERTP